MAKATVEPAVKKGKTITLELTEGEADFILSSVSRSGGDSRKSPRKYAERVMDALQDALGLSDKDILSLDALKLGVGSVHYANYDTGLGSSYYVNNHDNGKTLTLTALRDAVARNNDLELAIRKQS